MGNLLPTRFYLSFRQPEKYILPLCCVLPLRWVACPPYNCLQLLCHS
ncbi:MAG: hypothetical protein J5680_06145 [Neisseriaceae bacterium]|nr:hypothetical protein [Neisseriaceae bacterium]